MYICIHAPKVKVCISQYGGRTSCGSEKRSSRAKGEIPSRSWEPTAETMLPCDSMAPFGSPVVPEV